MYGVSKITIQPSLMMISVQDAEFSAGSLARYLQIFADSGVVVDMISQSAPHGTSRAFSFTTSSADLPQVMKAIAAVKQDPNAGKWIWVGGKFEPGESPDDCVCREVREEPGLVLTRWQFRGIVTFVSDTWPTEYMHLFTADGFSG